MSNTTTTAAQVRNRFAIAAVFALGLTLVAVGTMGVGAAAIVGGCAILMGASACTYFRNVQRRD